MTKNRLIILVCFIILAAAMGACFLICYAAGEKKFFSVNFIDVGQGDAIFIKTISGRTILIDGGPDDKVLGSLAKDLPLFSRHIDLMILTHPHDDHIFGQISVLRRYQVDRILYTGVQHDSPGYLVWLDLVRKQKIPLTIIDHPQNVVLDNNCVLKILYPQKSLLDREMKNLNNSSIVSILQFGKIKFFFSGDAEIEVENSILNQIADISADIFKVSHHGSDNANSIRLLEKIMPKIAIISVGKDNQFGHPFLRIIKRIERVNAKILRTDQDENIKVISDGQKYWLDN